MASQTVQISAIQDPSLQQLARAWGGNSETLDITKLPERTAANLQIFDRMVAAASGQAALSAGRSQPTAFASGLAPQVAERVIGAGLRGYQAGAAINVAGQPTPDTVVRVVAGLSPSVASVNCSNVATALAAGVSYYFGYGAPLGAMGGSAVGEFLDATGYCPTDKLARIAGDVAFVASFVPVDQVAGYTAVVWNGARYYLGYPTAG